MQVSTEEGRDLGQQLDVPFFETSASLRYYVDDAFHTVVRNIRKKEREEDRLNGKIRSSRWHKLRAIVAAYFQKNHPQWKRAIRQLLCQNNFSF